MVKLVFLMEKKGGYVNIVGTIGFSFGGKCNLAYVIYRGTWGVLTRKGKGVAAIIGSVGLVSHEVMLQDEV